MGYVIDALASPPGAAFIALAATLILFLESSRFPWSPFFILHAILAILLPVWLGAWPEGNFFAALLRSWRAALLFFALLAIWEHLVSGFLYEKRILKSLGKEGDPYHSPAAALEVVLDKATRKSGLPSAAAQAIFAGYALLWAPIGEELFFWGYLHVTLVPAMGFWPCTILVSAVFALHHLLYLGGLWDRRPWGSLMAFTASSFVTGILISLLFRFTDSLFPQMAVHAGLNAIWIALAMADRAPGGSAAPRS